MRPKGKLLALLVMFAAVGLITATGAFTTVEAERTAEVDVAGDDAALLQLQAESDVVEQQDDGLFIDLDSPGTADGLNPNAYTEFAPALNATNQGTNEDIELSVEIDVEEEGEIDADSVIIEAGDGTDLTSESVDLGVGQTVEINLIFDLTDDEGDQVNELSETEDITITFIAEEGE